MSRSRRLALALPPILAVLLILLLQLPALRAAGERNFWALAALGACLSPDPAAPALLPSIADPFFAAGLARCQENPAAARTLYRAALADPHTPIAALRGAFPADLDLARAAVAAQPTSASAHLWLADILRATDPLAAIAAYEQALALDPTDALAWDRLGHLYRAAGRLPAALSAFGQACTRLDQGKNGCMNAAGAAMELQDYPAAATYYRQAMRQLPNYQPAQAGYEAALQALQSP